MLAVQTMHLDYVVLFNENVEMGKQN